jgi:hypothetical protein
LAPTKAHSGLEENLARGVDRASTAQDLSEYADAASKIEVQGARY